MDCKKSKQIERPTITQLLLADFTENLPRRIRKRIEKSPQAAENWKWNRDGDNVVIESEKGERITLCGEVLKEPEQVTCSCLLTPRCYHVFACLAVLEVTDDATQKVAQPEAPEFNTNKDVAISEEQYDAGVAALDTLSEILAGGCCNAGLILEAKLLRIIHRAKSVSLHRLAANTTYLYKQMQNVKDKKPHDVVGAMRESLLTAHILTTKETCEVKWIGIGRRSYREIDQRKLFGIFSLPIISDSGYTGVSTWFTDEDHNLWSINSVQPGTREEIYTYYHSAPDLGDLSMTHHHLSRSQIFIKNARASFDHRLSAHKNAKAVSGGACSWDTPLIKKLWDIPLEEQLSVLEEKQQGFLFFRGKIEGVREHYIYLQIANDCSYEQYKWKISLPKIPSCLEAQKNYERLPLGEEFQCIARKEYSKITLVALRFATEHYNFSLDCLPRVKNACVIAATPEVSLSPIDLCKRRIRAAVLCGVSSFANDLALNVSKESFVLQENMLKTAVALLQGVHKAAQRPQRNSIGYRRELDEKQFASSWLKLAMYEKFFVEKDILPRACDA
ncbi:hypothetical protein [Candidatus Uabimicrobium amorphum]|uniref:SWIM-type domain-containing protein n=1 Tax=Uabimicrobium amorphum TaxID=2596890 RepID=A0A5S9IP94_UABAM|nr:hypothetical protein [Candidatus Uabimicrobium amorphum]BBM85374.1 hypothetical protein UABAM_03740 [Candidatus Uabimicrobium amorphum]